MKRQHRARHKVLWLLLPPVMAAVIWFAVDLRPEEPVNDALPGGLIAETE